MIMMHISERTGSSVAISLELAEEEHHALVQVFGREELLVVPRHGRHELDDGPPHLDLAVLFVEEDLVADPTESLLLRGDQWLPY